MKIIKILDERIEEIILVILLSLMTILTFAQVIMRYIVRSPLSWSEELIRYLFIWMTFVGISYGVKRGRHIKVDFIISFFPNATKKAVQFLSDLIFLGFSIFIVVKGYEITAQIFALKQTTPAMGIQMGYVYISIIFGFSLVIIRLLQNISKNFKFNEGGE